ncbi:hypothetical protein GCM10028812_11340 [Ancylobacter sonchi]
MKSIASSQVVNVSMSETIPPIMRISGIRNYLYQSALYQLKAPATFSGAGACQDGEIAQRVSASRRAAPSRR